MLVVIWIIFCSLTDSANIWSFCVRCNGLSAVDNAGCITELFAPRFCNLPCGGIGVDMDTVWCEDDTVLAVRLVSFWLLCSVHQLLLSVNLL